MTTGPSKIIYKAASTTNGKDKDKNKSGSATATTFSKDQNLVKTSYESGQKVAHQKLIKENPVLALYDKPLPVALPWYIKYFFYGIWVFIVVVIFLMLIAFQHYHDVREWWNTNDGKKYNKVFSINLFAQYNSFKLGGWIYGLFCSNIAQIPGPGAAEFLTDMISAFALFPADEGNTDSPYFMLPVNICETIAVGTFNRADFPGRYPDNASPSPDKAWIMSDSNGWPADVTTWQKLLGCWGVPLNESDYKPDDKGYIDGLNKKWQVDENFLYKRYGLPALSAFLLSFMWGGEKGPEGDEYWYPNSFQQAVGLNPISLANVDYSGGWWGFIKFGLGQETDIPFQTIVKYLYVTEHIPSKPSKCSGSQTASTIGLGVVAGAVAWGTLAVFAPELGLFAGALIGAGTAAGSIIPGLQSCGSIPGSS